MYVIRRGSDWFAMDGDTHRCCGTLRYVHGQDNAARLAAFLVKYGAYRAYHLDSDGR